MKDVSILNIKLPEDNKFEVLEKIKKNLQVPQDYFHIASLNPEILVLSQQDKEFRSYLNWAQIRILDGEGVRKGARFLGYQPGERYAGVDLMEKMLFLANDMGLRVGLIGGKGKIAERVVDCQGERFPRINFFALQGFSDISNPSDEEDNHILSIVADRKPHILFIAFGSPFQELWLNKHKERLKGITCMGVGGAFDFLSGNTPRAPYILRFLGLEWLFRLLIQPWRFKRQLRLFEFIRLILVQKISSQTQH